MSGDKSIATANEQSGQTPGETSQHAQSLFGSEYLGEGEGLNERTKAEEDRLAVICGRKLRRARQNAGLTLSAAGIALALKGVTNVSLYENGHRMPPTAHVRALAQLYGVTTDYLLDMHDDILAEPEEGNQAVLRGIVTASLSQNFTQFVETIANRNSIMIEALSLDRVLLAEVAVIATELAAALGVVKAHAEDFDGIRGGAKLVRLISELHVSMGKQIQRRKREESLLECEAYQPAPEMIVQQVQQLLF
jgi:transcriptional regulator with XRE-family HTH domain